MECSRIMCEDNESMVTNIADIDISPLQYDTYEDGSVKKVVKSRFFTKSDWKTFKEFKPPNFGYNSGIPLGLIELDNGEFGKLSYRDDKHLITIATSGTGKNAAAQIPVLLQYDAPVFCIDPKGENALVTAKYRKEGMNHDVVVINPFGVYADRFNELGIPQVGFNPLASLDPDANDFVTQVNAVCELLIEQQGNDPFWSDAARSLVACLIMFVCKTRPPSECNLIEVRRLLMQGETKLHTEILPLIASDYFEPMAEKAKSFLKSNKTINSVILTAQTQMNFLHDGYLSESLSSYSYSNIDFRTLRQCRDQNVTVFLVVPIDRISSYQKWFRMIVHTALTVLRTEHKTATKKVLVMVDECKAIGYLPALENSLAYARGFGIQIWCFFQNYGQIQSLYPNEHEFFANVDIQQFFTVNDNATAEMISKRIGKTTALCTTSPFYQNKIHFEPNELFGLSPDYQIIFSFGFESPLFSKKDYYFKNPILKERADWNPYSPKNKL